MMAKGCKRGGKNGNAKRAWRTREIAMCWAVLTFIKYGERTGVYRCPTCLYWHASSKASRKQVAEQDRIMAGGFREAA